jgi:putative intracellular protease/amidase
MRAKIIALIVIVSLAGLAGLWAAYTKATTELEAEYIGPAAPDALEGLTMLIVLPGDGYRDETVYVPRDVFAGSQGEVRFAAPTMDEAKAAIIGTLQPDLTLADVVLEDYAGVVFAGWEGEGGLATIPEAAELARAASAAGMAVGGIGSSIEVLEAAGLVAPLEVPEEVPEEAPQESPPSEPDSADDEPPVEATEEPVPTEDDIEEAAGGEAEGAPAEETPPEPAEPVEPEEPTEAGEGEDAPEAATENGDGPAERVIPPTEEQLADEDFEPINVLRDGTIVTALGPRDAAGFAQEMIRAVQASMEGQEGSDE